MILTDGLHGDAKAIADGLRIGGEYDITFSGRNLVGVFSGVLDTTETNQSGGCYLYFLLNGKYEGLWSRSISRIAERHG
ncbi:MAG: hypothetical protein ACKO0Z_21215 [Betaproteobacteria bacterium]